MPHCVFQLFANFVRLWFCAAQVAYSVCFLLLFRWKQLSYAAGNEVDRGGEEEQTKKSEVAGFKTKAMCWKMLKCSVKLSEIVELGDSCLWVCQYERSLSVFSLELCWRCYENVIRSECSRDFCRKVSWACVQTWDKHKILPAHLCNKVHVWKGLEREKERLHFLSQWCQQPQLTHLHGEREQKKRERERREGLRHERKAEGRGKFAGVTEEEK